MISCEIELDLSRTKDRILIEHHNNITEVNFMITSAVLYVPVVTLSVNDNVKFLENIKQGFKRTISSNKCRSETTTQPNSNNLDYVIDPTVRNINILFVLSLKDSNKDLKRNYFDKYYVSLVEIKSFNALVDNKAFFEQPEKKNKKHKKNLSKCKKTMITQQNIYSIICIIKIIINVLA